MRKIYLLKNLPAEVRAVTFAKCSRSPKSFQEIAKELTEEKSKEFHEKWVVGYGHSSVAEHAVLSIAIENVSILASKVIEDCRLASFTEKSTRYQIFDKSKYYKPENVMNSEFGKLYSKTLDFLLDFYIEIAPLMIEFIKKKYPKEEKMSDKLYESLSLARACDVIRYLLPTATYTNLGMTVNARELEYAIQKFLSHPLKELQDISRELKKAAKEEVPTLVKYADYNKYLNNTQETLEKLSKEFLSKEKPEEVEPVKIVDWDEKAENRLITALIYRGSNLSFNKIMKKVKEMRQEDKVKIIDEVLKNRGPHDRPPRELEHIYYTFDILLDFGAFRDIQRHRICTQTNQKLGVKYGYEIPLVFEEIGLKERFTEAMEKAKEAYEKIYLKFPEEASYVLPLAYKKRVLITWNLRELFHFIELRSSLKGHSSYRKIAILCWEKLNEIHPHLVKYIRVYKSDTEEHT